jgi:hypothetical protein
MTAALIVVAILVVLAAVCRIQCTVDPFTTRGRRRGYYRAQGWWRGANAANRCDRWT